MAGTVKLLWEPTFESGLSRRAQRGCWYEPYLPDPLTGRAFTLDAKAAADVSAAERALLALDRSAEVLADSEAIARLLLRAEAVASSKIEGLQVGGRRLLKAQLLANLGQPATDATATEILGAVNAMRWSVDVVAGRDHVAVADLQEIHRRLFEHTDLHELGGALRTEQNWIGGSAYNPCSAAFVPPPAERVSALLEDLCAFCSSSDLPPVAQAAIAHAQFETIHPFADGNGRTGRALIHVILRRRGITPRVLAPISLVLATWSNDYVDGLTGTRYLGDPSGRAAHLGLAQWISVFSSAAQRAVDDARDYQARVAEIQARWRAQLGKVRADAAALRLIAALPGSPVVTVQTAAVLIGRSIRATNVAVAQLVDAGVLEQTTVGRRNRAFEATALIEAFTSLERQLASPDADTRRSPPARQVPSRPR